MLIKEDKCDICHFNLSDEAVAHAHYHGSKHMNRLLKMLADKGEEVPKKKSCVLAENLMSPERCDLCRVDLNGAYNASLHYSGASHQKRLNNVNNMVDMEVEAEEEQPVPMMNNTFEIGSLLKLYI